MIRVACLTALILSFGAVDAVCATINVPADHPSIQEAIDVAIAGDEILVAPGTYKEGLTLPFDRVLSLRSSGGPSTTVLSGAPNGSGPGFSIEASTYVAVENRVLACDQFADQVLSIDLSTGDRTVISSPTLGTGPVFSWPRAIDYDITNNRAVVWDRNLRALFLVDLATGDRTVFSDAVTGAGDPLDFVEGVVFDLANNRAIVMEHNLPPSLVGVDLTTGDRTILSGDGVGVGPDLTSTTSKDLKLDLAGGVAFILTEVGFETALLEVDLATGDRTILSSPIVGTGPDFGPFNVSPYQEICYDSVADRVAIMVNSAQVIEVDRATGNRAEIANVFTGPGVDYSGAVADLHLDFAQGVAFGTVKALVFELDLATNGRSVISDFGDRSVFCNSSPLGTTLEGFTITDNTVSPIYVNNGNAIVRDCVIRDNVMASEQGGAIRVTNGTLTVESCEFLRNSAPRGAAISTQFTDVVVRSSLFSANSASLTGGAFWFYNGTILAENCVFTGNHSQSGGAVLYNWNTGDVEFRNCTMVHSSGNSMRLISGAIGTSVVLRSCIARLNGTNSVSSQVTGEYTNFEGNLGGTGNIDLDPLFLDVDGLDDIPGNADDDLRLALGSPCVGIGDPDSGILSPADLDGNPRVVACRVDMGAFESSELGPDCNANAEADACELLNGTSLDVNGNTIPDQCEGFLAYNATQDVLHVDIASALLAANAGDQIQAPASSFPLEPTLDLRSTPVDLVSLGALTQPEGGSYDMGDGTKLRSPSDGIVTFDGSGTVRFGATVSFDGLAASVGVGGSLSLEPAAEVHVDATAGLISRGTVDNYGAAVSVVGGVLNDVSATWSMYGDLLGNFSNEGNVAILADTQLVGDYLNEISGTTTVQNGTLTVIGTLTNNGTLVGDATGMKQLPSHSRSAKSSGHALTVFGDYAAGAAATLLSPGGGMQLRWAGNVDIAIDSAARFDLAEATMNMVALAGSIQELEVMSLDIGANPAGLNPGVRGHFPVGTLRIGPSATTVSLVDHRDNDLQGQGSCEVLYVRNLVVEAGTTLLTNQCRVYYETLTLAGAVDEAGNLIDVNNATGIGPIAALPTATVLLQNHPNPFNPRTSIRFDLKQEGRVQVVVFDLAGRRVRMVHQGVLPRARHEFIWRGDDDRGKAVASGVYLYRLETGDEVQTRRMTLVR